MSLSAFISGYTLGFGITLLMYMIYLLECRRNATREEKLHQNILKYMEKEEAEKNERIKKTSQ